MARNLLLLPVEWKELCDPRQGSGLLRHEFGWTPVILRRVGLGIYGDAKLSRARVGWQVKAVLPVAVVLLIGLSLFLLATVSLRDPERHAVLMVAAAGAVAICAVLTFVLAHSIQRPMVELQEKIAEVSQGNLNVRVNFSRRDDEIGDLGRNFNRMLQQLREGQGEIERLHRTQMTRAEHLTTLGELATGLAHEIRNPLAGIAGVIEIVGRDLPTSSPARAVVKDIRREIAHINRAVTDLVEMARPHPPQIRLRDLNTTVEHAVIVARQQALSRPIQIELVKSVELPAVDHDSIQIHQVLLNLLLNAVQAIDHEGIIHVETVPHEGSAMIVVSDTGRGIPPENLPNIFRAFYTTKGNGTGLGLSLARRLVEEHHGRIEVSSIVGEGSKFVVFLPLGGPLVEPTASQPTCATKRRGESGQD